MTSAIPWIGLLAGTGGSGPAPNPIGAGVASGFAVAQAVAGIQVRASGASSGTATVGADAVATVKISASSSGLATAVAQAFGTNEGAGYAAGTATVTAQALSEAFANGIAAGFGFAEVDGSGTAQTVGTGTARGTASVLAVSAPTISAVGSVSGIGSAAANGASTVKSLALSQGIASATAFPFAGLTNIVASVAIYNVTITADSSSDLTNGVYGIEFGDGAGGVYTEFVNVPGAVTNQSVTIGVADGVIPGDDLSYRPYYNLDPLDPPSGRVYGTAGTVNVPTLDTSGAGFSRGSSTPVASAASEIGVGVTGLAQGVAVPTGSAIARVVVDGLSQGIAVPVAIPPAGIASVVATLVGYNLTVTAATSDITDGVYGLEYGDGSGGTYTDFVNTPGASSNQTITIGTVDGVIPGDYLSYKPYYNTDPLDPQSTRTYGTAGTTFVPEYDGLMLGQG